MQVELQSPNIAKTTIKGKEHTGKWTMIYDEVHLDHRDSRVACADDAAFSKGQRSFGLYGHPNGTIDDSRAQDSH